MGKILWGLPIRWIMLTVVIIVAVIISSGQCEEVKEVKKSEKSNDEKGNIQGKNSTAKTGVKKIEKKIGKKVIKSKDAKPKTTESTENGDSDAAPQPNSGDGSLKSLGKNWCYLSKECDQSAPKSDWNKGDCKIGTLQSPIDIKMNMIVGNGKVKGGKVKAKDLRISKKDLAHYVITKYQLTNTGSTISLSGFTTETGKAPYLEWPDTIDALYKLDRIELHWGANSSYGSEHTINGKAASGEAHLIYYRSDEGPDEDGFSSYKDAVESDEPDAVAIVSLLLQGLKSLKSSSFLESIAVNVKKVGAKDGQITVNSALKLNEVLDRQKHAYSYMGSLTAPPCNEVVAWLVCTDTVTVREEELEELRMAVKELNEPLVENRRNIQSIKSDQPRPIKEVKMKS